MNKTPNLLVVTTDQQRADLLGCAGRVPVRTPRLDQFREQGLLFHRAYAACPLCTPARATLVTGQYPSRHGAWSIGTALDEDCVSLPRQLAEQGGYRTAMIGKSHLQPGSTPGSFEAPPRSRDWDFFRNWQGPWYGFDEAKISIGHTHEPHAYAMHYGLWLRDRGIPDREPYFYTNPDGRQSVGEWALPEAFHPTKWVEEETLAYLERHQAEHKDRPFFLSVNFPDPHRPFVVPEPWCSLHEDAEPPEPVRTRDEDNGTTLYRATREGRLKELGWHDHAGPPCQHLEPSATGPGRSEEELRMWRVYMGMQSMVDHSFGKILDRLAELGLDGNTLVVFLSDHGDLMGDHWMWSKGGSHYDAAVRIPLLMRWPGHIPAGSSSDSLISQVDLPATLMRAAGLDPHPRMQGVDQLAELLEPNRNLREGVLIDHRVERGLYVNSWITRTHRLSVHSILAEKRDEMELYDFTEDPDEMNNVALNSEQQTRIRQMAAQLIRYRMGIAGPWQSRPSFA
ncbi:MAG: sulfatase-like hydrolase/transferase [Verrucomicrobia bacterium]|nr:sulfatase-like hydrolase/transferase [Verrucomicrobiota bacterium]